MVAALPWELRSDLSTLYQVVSTRGRINREQVARGRHYNGTPSFCGTCDAWEYGIFINSQQAVE